MSGKDVENSAEAGVRTTEQVLHKLGPDASRLEKLQGIEGLPADTLRTLYRRPDIPPTETKRRKKSSF